MQTCAERLFFTVRTSGGFFLRPPETVRTFSSILEFKLLFLEAVGAQL